MVTDFQGIFDLHGIDYTMPGHGQHTAGNIGINCPFCAAEGDPDPSKHLGINVDTGAWSCWRNAAHRGRLATRLLCAVLRVSAPEARRLCGERQRAHTERELQNIEAKFAPKTDVDTTALSAVSQVEFGSFVRLESRTASYHRDYLARRNFGIVHSSHHVMCGIIGRWAARLIFPVRAPDGDVVTWTSRMTNDLHTPKYLALAPPAGANIKHHLLGVNTLRGGKRLVVCEGPMDALKINEMADDNTHATCTFGTSVSPEQGYQLRAISKKYDSTIFMFDKDASVQARHAMRYVTGSRAGALTGVDDPGDLNPADTAHRVMITDALRALGV